MVKYVFVLVAYTLVVFNTQSQVILTNDGLALTLEAGLTATIKGSYVNQTNGADLGTIDNAGVISLTHDWTNNSANTVFSTNTGLTSFVGTLNAQTIGGSNSTSFYNLTLNNTFGTFPQVSSSVDLTVKNTLTMTDGAVDMGGNTATIGISAGAPGSLSHGEDISDGFFMNGVMTRYFNTGTIVDGNVAQGMFPLGSENGSFQPFYLSASAAITTGGTVSVDRVNALFTSAVFFADGASTVLGRQNSNWAVSTGGGLAGGTYNAQIRGTGYGVVGAVADLRLTLTGSVVGTAGVNAGTPANPIVRRTGIALADLNNSFYLSTTNVVATPLPVELLSFTAVKDGEGSVNVYWVTGIEINSAEFVIEKSVDGVNFTVVNVVEAAGNSEDKISYETLDHDPYEGVSYYRLKQVDLDGSFVYTHLELVTNENVSTKVYPVPAYNSAITVELDNLSGGSASLQIFDQVGSLVHEDVSFSTEAGSIIKSISPEVFTASGVYFLRFKTEQTELQEKIIFYK